MKRVVYLASLMLILASPLGAQTLLPSYNLLGPAQSYAELEQRLVRNLQWLNDYSAQQEWAAVWLNYYGRVASRTSDGRVRIFAEKRHPIPVPPVWLVYDCQETVEGTSLAEVCRKFRLWQDDLASQMLRLSAMRDIATHESPRTTRFRTYLHIDGLWLMTSSDALVYAPIGTHLSFSVAGRFEMFLGPGALLLSVPNATGGRSLQPAYDYGLGFRLTEFRLPVLDRRVGLHFNFAKAWLFQSATGDLDSSVTLMGLSLASK